MSCIMSMNFMIILNHDGDWNCIGSKKGVQIEEEVLTRFYPSPKSFWSCTHVNSCQKYKLYINLHILLNMLS